MTIQNSAIITLRLDVADRTVTRLLKNIKRGIELPKSSYNSNQVQLPAGSSVPVVVLGDADAKLVVLIPQAAVNVTVQFLTVAQTFEGITLPLVLPGAIVSFEIENVDTTEDNSVFVFQGS